MGRGGAVLPAAQGLHGDRAAQRTRLLPVEPQAQALLTEHVLGTEGRAAHTHSMWDTNPSLPKLMVYCWFVIIALERNTPKAYNTWADRVSSTTFPSSVP